VWAALASFCVLAAPTPAQADLPPDCTSLGGALTEHSCFHVHFGPTTTVLATPGSEPDEATPALDSVHTEHRVGLPTPGATSVATYTPQRSGQWVVFLEAEVPIAVAGPDGALLSPVFEVVGETGCEYLPVARAFSLVQGTTYRLLFGPTEAPEVGVVIEYVDDFLVNNGRDDDGDGFGRADDVVVSPCTPPVGYAPNDLDCDDADATVHPLALEVCGDTVDQNCTGSVDDIGLVCHVGQGACQRSGQGVCAAPGGTVSCDAVAGAPEAEACNNADDDCDGSIDETSECSGTRPVCIRSGSVSACGCALDADCGAKDSGLRCDAASGTCIPGCSDAPGANGCPAEQVCDGGSCIPAPIGAGGGGDSDAGPGSGGDGCGCRVAGQGGTAPSHGALMGALFSALLGVSVVRRRRYRLACCGWLLLVAGGCSNEVTAEPGSGGRADGGGGGGAGGGGEECTLGDKPIEHACSHGMNGKFFGVVASSSPAEALGVNQVHGVYDVAVPGEGTGWVSFRPARSGEHVLFTRGLVVLDFLDEGSEPIARTSLGAPPGCPVFDASEVMSVGEGSRYSIRLQSAGPEGVLYFEHLPSFGAKAWECSSATGVP
jgi:MYXO-CTERM domain-containing protein